MRRRTQEKVEEAEPITVEEALNYDLGEGIYRKVSDLVKQYGNNLILRVYQEKSNQFTSGYLGEISGTEIDAFIGGPEIFLKENYGAGVFKVVVVNGSNKRFLAHLTISIALPKNINPTTTPQVNFDDLSKARKEGRQEILEVASLMKSPTPNNQPALDLTRLIELTMAQNKEAREREEKLLERIRSDENRLRERELAMIEKAYANSTDLTAHLKPIFDSMSIYGKVFSNSLSMVEKILAFRDTFSSETGAPEQRGFIERILISIGERLLEGNPQLFDKISSPLIQPTPNRPITTRSAIGNNQPNKTEQNIPILINEHPENPTVETNSYTKTEPQAHQFNFETFFQALLTKYVRRATRDEDPVFCADALLSDLEDLLEEKLITPEQLNEVINFIISEQLEPYITKFYPGISLRKAWLLDFQSGVKEGIINQNETETQRTN